MPSYRCFFTRLTRSLCCARNCAQALKSSRFCAVVSSCVSTVFSLLAGGWVCWALGCNSVCKKLNKEKGSTENTSNRHFFGVSKNFTQKSVEIGVFLIALIFVLIYNRICVRIAFLSHDKKMPYGHLQINEGVL